MEDPIYTILADVADEYRQIVKLSPRFATEAKGFIALLGEISNLEASINLMPEYRHYAKMREECIMIAATAVRMILDSEHTETSRRV